MKACLLLLFFLHLPTASAAERIHGAGATLTSRPATFAGEAIHRKEVSEAARKLASENKELFQNLKPGQVMIIQNSTQELDDEVVVVTDVFDDGSVRIKRQNGSTNFVNAKNLAATLSPEVGCGDSHGEQICKGDMIFYPVRTSSMEIPEAKAAFIFKNGSVVVRDGGEFVFELKQVGKARACSPQRESICVGDYVYAESFREDQKFPFEGPVEKIYTHGVVIVRVNDRWRYPIDVAAVKERIATDNPLLLDPAVITTRGSRGKELPYNVMPELEPLDPNKADNARDVR